MARSAPFRRARLARALQLGIPQAGGYAPPDPAASWPRHNRVLRKLRLVLESSDFLGNIVGCLWLRFWLRHGCTPGSWRYCWLPLGLWLRLHGLSGLRLVHGIGRYRRVRRLCDFLIRRKTPTLLEQAAKDTGSHRFGVGRDKHDAVPTAPCKNSDPVGSDQATAPPSADLDGSSRSSAFLVACVSQIPLWLQVRVTIFSNFSACSQVPARVFSGYVEVSGQ